MIKAREWPMRAMYILIAAALALSLFITAAPAHKVSANSNDVNSQWTKVSTPSTDHWVLAPESTIIDFALASQGAVAYAIVDSYWEVKGDYYLLKSTDSGATWTDITDALEKVDEDYTISSMLRVETDGVNPDFLAVAVWEDSEVRVYISIDGGDTFDNADEVVDSGLTLAYGAPNHGLSDLAVSPEVAGKRDIAVGGIASDGEAALFRSTVKADVASAWEDATDYNGWDDGCTNSSFGVTFLEFSPNYATDKTILVTTVNPTGWPPFDIYLQAGSFVSTPGWNDKSTLGIDAVLIMHNAYIIGTPSTMFDPRIIAGLTLPSDYNSKSTDTRVLWVWVNYNKYNSGTDSYDVPASQIVRVDNDSADPVVQQVKDGNVWLTNVNYFGTTAEGEALAGLLGSGTDYTTGSGCAGVQVYRNTGIHNMDICCQRWLKACKPPTGETAMAVWFVSEDKAYAVALQGVFPYDEGAWSVTFDGGNTWNQLSLIDTDIDYLSDVAVSPDCNKMMLVSVNTYGCDSVWLKAKSLPEAEEYSGKWLRTWCGELEGDSWYEYTENGSEAGLLRLPATETTGDTVYLVDYGTSNIYRNDLETLGCWTSVGSATLTDIVDVVATDADTLYALDYSGDFSLYDSEGWHDAVDSKVDNGWSIAVHGDDILVGSYKGGEVSYSSDGGETFDLLEDESGVEVDTPIPGHVTVAFDTYFDTNNVIYAAVEGWNEDDLGYGGIYRWVIGTSTDWKDLGADHDYGYTGLVLSNINGNPYTIAATGGVLYASFVVGDGSIYNSDWSNTDDWFNCWKNEDHYYYTGVARCLTPAGDISCEKCVEWDYLTVGLTSDVGFQATPKALKMCGCLTPDTNGKLFAIDSWGAWDYGYDMDKAQIGTVWTFEDCYAKKAPTLVSPANNVTIPADCYCANLPFSLKWDGVCDACYYDVQIALDNEFDNVVYSDYEEGTNDIVGATGLSFVVQDDLTCQVTYYWRVRAHEASTCQIIHSWWSDTGTITVAPSVAQGTIDLIAPVSGATDVGIKNVGFSWHLQATANKFDWKLSTNADLSSPLESKTGLTNTAYTSTAALVHGTTYYWQVKAYQGSTLVSTSAIGTFTTGALGKFCDPIDGLCFDTQDALTQHEATAHPAPATPMWVWVVIAIGAVLVIVVIVLIFRTRRV